MVSRWLLFCALLKMFDEAFHEVPYQKDTDLDRSAGLFLKDAIFCGICEVYLKFSCRAMHK